MRSRHVARCRSETWGALAEGVVDTPPHFKLAGNLARPSDLVSPIVISSFFVVLELPLSSSTNSHIKVVRSSFSGG